MSKANEILTLANKIKSAKELICALEALKKEYRIELTARPFPKELSNPESIYFEINYIKWDLRDMVTKEINKEIKKRKDFLKSVESFK
jgi:hypothetical protein